MRKFNVEGELNNRKDIRVYAIKDRLVGKFLAPFYAETNAEAVRFFKSQLNNITLWKDNSKDFELYYLASFDEAKGLYYNMEEIELVAAGDNVKE